MLPTDKKQRKETPLATGFLDYFPDAIAAVARVSFIGNQEHNPGEPLHWSREKSNDHPDCLLRHFAERGTIDTDGMRHSAKIAWRALALLQIEIENDQKPSPIHAYLDVQRKYQDKLKASLREELDKHTDLAEHTHASTSDRKTVYISGPMRGKPDLNFPAFDAAKKILQEKGYFVISPADMDRNDDKSVKRDQAFYAKRDIEAINQSNYVCVLPGWEVSEGAKAEIYYAKWVGKKFLTAVGQPFDFGYAGANCFRTEINLGAA